MIFSKVNDNYEETYVGDIITISGNQPIGIAMDNAKYGEDVIVAMTGSICFKIDDGDTSTPGTNSYKVPIINMETSKI